MKMQFWNQDSIHCPLYTVYEWLTIQFERMKWKQNENISTISQDMIILLKSKHEINESPNKQLQKMTNMSYDIHVPTSVNV